MTGAAGCGSLPEISPGCVPTATPRRASTRAGAAQKKARPRARKARGLRTRKLSADRARLAGRGGHRLAGLDHCGFQPSIGRAGVGDAGGNAKAGDQRRANEGHRHHLQVGHAVGRKHREIVRHTLPQNLPVIGRGGAMEGSMGCLRKKVGRAGCFPSPLHETLKTCDSNKLTRQGEAAAGCASGTPHPRKRGSQSAKPRMNSKGWSAWHAPERGRARLKRSLIENRVAVSTSALFRQRPGEGAD